MLRFRMLIYALLLAMIATIPCAPADPPPAPLSFNPLRLFKRSPFTAEAEVYAGGITGDKIGAGFQSLTQGDYGTRFTFGFLKGINFTLDYMYSNQDRLFTAVTPATAVLPSGVLLMRAANLNMGFGSGEIYFLQTKRTKFYVSPGIGFARNGGRSLTFRTPLGSASSPILAGTAVTFNLGGGVKIYPWKHLGFRFDLRDHVSGGGTGNLDSLSSGPGQLAPCPPNCIISSPAQYFGSIPVQNNVVFTIGLIFRII